MKLKILPEVQIASHIYRIVFSTKFLEETDARGQSNATEQVIRLSNLPGRSDRQKFETLIHEIDHQNNYQFGIDADEKVVTVRGEALTISLLSLGIEPDFSEIPEEEL